MKHEMTEQEAADLLDEVEAFLADETGKAIRHFLRGLTEAATRPDALTASVEPNELPGQGPITLGQTAGWWSQVANSQLMPAIRKAWELAYQKFRGGQIAATSIDALPEFVQTVRDRLVQGLTPPVYEDSFDRIRTSIVQSAAQGWTRPQLAQRIAAELSWEDRGPYWRDQLAATDRKIDAILDPLGEPDTPARDWAQHNDPVVRALRDDRNRAIKHLDAEQSYWKTRADRIARTESTAAQNNAALQALQDEDWASKEWLATHDSRTRPSHAALHGQRVEVGSPFVVNGYELQHPGDPSAPPGETVNCRCALVGSDEPPTEAQDTPEPEPESAPDLTFDEHLERAKRLVEDFPDEWTSTPLDADGRLSPEMQQALDSIKAAGAELRGRIDPLITGGIEDTHRQLASVTQQMKEAMENSDWDLLSSLSDSQTRLQGELHELQGKLRVAAYREIKAIRPMGKKGAILRHTGVPSPRTLNAFEVAQTYYPEEWLQRLDRRGKISLSQGPRGFYRYSDNSIVLSGGTGVMAHELGHAMEGVIKGLTEMEWAFWASRSIDYRPDGSWSFMPMERIYATGPEELGVKDNWADPYTGKVYGLNGSVANQGWEIFTTGIESMFNRSKFFLRPDGTVDTDFMDFMLGVLGAL